MARMTAEPSGWNRFALPGFSVISELEISFLVRFRIWAPLGRAGTPVALGWHVWTAAVILDSSGQDYLPNLYEVDMKMAKLEP